MSPEIGQNVEKPDHIMSFLTPSGGSCKHYKEGATIAVGGVHAERNIDKMETVEFEHLNLLLKVKRLVLLSSIHKEVIVKVSRSFMLALSCNLHNNIAWAILEEISIAGGVGFLFPSPVTFTQGRPYR